MTNGAQLPADIAGNDITLTVFLKHDQSKPLEEFQAILNDRGWWTNFPPEGVEILSWNVVMGIGQIATLRLPVNKLQAVNVALERYAWGVFRTETFISYDFMGVRERLKGEAAARVVDAVATDGPVPSGAYGSHHPRLPHNGLSIEPHQTRNRPPTAWENQLGDALEAAFADGLHEVSELVSHLNASGVPAPEGDAWTDDAFKAVMADLGPPVESGRAETGSRHSGKA